MSESPIQAQTQFPGTSPFTSAAGGYKLSDDLARLCLPQEYRDSYRKLAWVNSICFLFLVVGLIGLKPPNVVVRPITEVTDVVPVIFTPPEEPPKTPEIKQDEPEEQPTERPTEVPQVAVVVAAADPSSVAFAVPVPGAVLVAPMAHLATPPPPVVKAPPTKPTQFNPNGGEGGGPGPEYPLMAQRDHYEGTVIIDIRISETGTITSAKVFKSSGYTILDDAALQVVQHRWRFPPGQQRWYNWSCIFRLQ